MRWVAAIVSMLAAAGGAASVHAQDVTAEVRTWTGQSWRLSEPALYVYATIFEKEGAAEGETVTPLAQTQAAAPNIQLSGSMKALSTFMGKPPVPRSALRQADVVTLWKDGVETQVPLASIDIVHFLRERVAGSSLPPYVAPTHVRHSVTVGLRDGSRLDADYVNLSTAVLRGTTSQGRVDIPWDEIEMVRFVR